MNKRCTESDGDAKDTYERILREDRVCRGDLKCYPICQCHTTYIWRECSIDSGIGDLAEYTCGMPLACSGAVDGLISRGDGAQISQVLGRMVKVWA